MSDVRIHPREKALGVEEERSRLEIKTYTRQQAGELDIQPLCQSPRKRCVPNNHNVLQQGSTDIDVACHDRVVDELGK